MLLTLLPQNICKTCEWYSVHFWFQTLSSFSLLEKGPIFSPLHSVYPNDWYLSLVAQTVKASAYNVGDRGSIPGLGRSPGEGNGNPLQYFCPENPIDGGNLVGYRPWGHKELEMTEWLFSHYRGCLFNLLIASFIVKKLLSLIRSHLFIFAFISLLWEVHHRGSCCGLCQGVFCLCFPIGVF